MKLCEKFIGFIQQFRQFGDFFLACQSSFPPMFSLPDDPA